jgi:predicted O-methyltransferase YrrM
MTHKLKTIFRWPTEKPTIEPSSHHWFGGGNAQTLKKLITEINPKYILEMGSWTGIGSTNFILKNTTPDVQMVCIDHWSTDIEDHIQSSFTREQAMELYDEISNLWETFLVNNWEYQQRLTPIRKKTNEGLDFVSKLDIPFDLIYIDAHHDYENVLYDIETAGKYWPNAVLCGDDYRWPNGDVERAVKMYADKNNLNVMVNDQCWYYEK